MSTTRLGWCPLSPRLASAGVEVVSSGGTAAALEDAGLSVTRVSEVTGAPEILDGRVKTLHPRIHGGILARGESDQAELEANGIERFDLVVCNLYPFSETVAAGSSEPEIIEKIDIGGPAMVRAAAKNHRHVAVVTSPDQYDEVAAAIEGGGLDEPMKRRLAAEAFFHTAAYDAAIVDWIGDDRVLPLRHVGELRYGENPHQEASVFRIDGATSWWAEATQHQGKEMSFNNYVDGEAAWRLAADLGPGAVAVIKHTNASGAALGSDPLEVFESAWAGDPLSAFGSVIGINGELTVGVAEAIADRFVEVVIARDVSSEALDVLATKKNLRILTADSPGTGDRDYRAVEGGFLSQSRDHGELSEYQVVSNRAPTDDEITGMRFAWTVVAHVQVQRHSHLLTG